MLRAKHLWRLHIGIRKTYPEYSSLWRPVSTCTESGRLMISETDSAYIAGLFDGEGSITYKQYMRQRKHQKKAYPTWSIRMEIAMTDKSVIVWLHEVLGVGTLGEKRYKTKYTVVNSNNTDGIFLDEIEQYRSCRYFSASEAIGSLPFRSSAAAALMRVRRIKSRGLIFT